MGIIIREHKIAESSLVCFQQMRLYDRLYGYKQIFEYYLLQGMADYLANQEGSRLWVAEDRGEIIGAIAIVKTAGDAAKLRWFYVEPEYHGQGLGQRLVARALDFCRERGYKSIELWTVSDLAAARHIYAKFGFRLAQELPNSEWTDHEIIEEQWTAELT